MMLTTDASGIFSLSSSNIISCAGTWKQKMLQYTPHLATRDFEEYGSELQDFAK